MAGNASPEGLTISQAATILRRHEGSITAIARKLDVRVSTVSRILAEVAASQRIEKAVIKKALALLEQERAQQGTAA
jgi:DNA invertase Pin-like site-specific DNA recombinase